MDAPVNKEIEEDVGERGVPGHIITPSVKCLDGHTGCCLEFKGFAYVWLPPDCLSVGLKHLKHSKKSVLCDTAK